MPTRLIQPSLIPVLLSQGRLNRLAAGLALAAGPAFAAPAFAGGVEGTPEGVVRASDRPVAAAPESVVPVAGEVVSDSATLQSCPPAGPDGGHTTYVPGGLHGGHPHPGLTHGLPLIPPLAGYDAYLPPDYGWQVPIAYPVQREVYRYGNWYPDQWYGLPGSQKPRVAPHVFMPTDTTQLGYYHQQVPTWQPPDYSVFPQAPDPRVLHHTAQAGGPSIGVRPGLYPHETRVDDHLRNSRLGRLIQNHHRYGAEGYGSYGYGVHHGGTIVDGTSVNGPVAHEPILPCPEEGPAAPTENYGEVLDGPPAAPPAPNMEVEPLPSSTQPLPEADGLEGDVPPSAPAPDDDAILAPAREA